MKFAQPNVKEKNWQELVRSTGSILSGYFPTQVHHVIGRKSKHNKLAIGFHFILPLTATEHHLVDEGRSGMHEIKELWFSYHGNTDFDKIMIFDRMEMQKYLFAKQCEKTPFPFGQEYYDAIMDYHK